MSTQKCDEEINTYKAHPAKIIALKDLTEDTRYFKVRFVDESIIEEDYRPGQLHAQYLFAEQCGWVAVLFYGPVLVQRMP